MSEISFIKIKLNMFDDEKIKLIESLPDKDTIFYIWIRLLVLAGKVNDGGLIYVTETMPYKEEMLASIFGRPLNTVKMALVTLQDFDMISVMENGRIVITNWIKHQNVEGMDKIRQLNAERVKRHRERQLSKSSVTLCNVTVTQQIKNKNRDTEEECNASGETPSDTPAPSLDHRKISDRYIELLKPQVRQVSWSRFWKHFKDRKNLTTETVLSALEIYFRDGWVRDHLGYDPYYFAKNLDNYLIRSAHAPVDTEAEWEKRRQEREARA